MLAEAERRAAEPPLPELDATDVPLVTLDPVGSRDLDQAVHLAARGGRLPGQLRDRRRRRASSRWAARSTREARRRGQTLYSPDRRTPLHPPVLSEGAASLLADQLRPAVLWTIDLDADGEPVRVDLRRARVRSRAQLDYPAVQAQADAGTLPEPLALLPEIGAPPAAAGGRTRRHRARHARAGGGRDARTAAGRWRCAATCPSRAGTPRSRCSPAAARPALMLDGGVGLLRTLPPARPEDVARLRLLAPALGVDWPADAGPGRGHRRPGPDPPRARGVPRGGGHPAPRRRVHAVRRRPARAAAAQRGRGAVRARHRPAAPAGRPLRHRGLPRAGRRPASPRRSCGRRCPSCRR